ncbi:1877_t:CDS:2 [Dentiscutata erythropus]|uniref:1877_t:CDS:1 n=1 Tax=Dentiscutata erythropus TaxID=1348616 RepID=A0A9N8ZUQ2_9GLOM|nr:1877_t:CDS:2 [Dentiscutata erythropus]
MGELKFDQYYVNDSLDINALIGVSDVNHVILHVERDYSIEDFYNFGQGDDYKKPALIAIYSVKSAIDKLDDTLNEGGLILDNMRFIGSKTNERLLFSFYINETDQRQFSIVNPHSLTIKDAELIFREIECYKRLKACTILFDYIIKVESKHLNIKSLDDHDGWSIYIKKRDVKSEVLEDGQDNEFDPLFKNKSFDKLIDSFYGTDSYYN